MQYSWKGIIVFQEMLFYRQEVNIPTYLFFILLVAILTHFATNKSQPNTLYMYLSVKVIDNWSRRQDIRVRYRVSHLSVVTSNAELAIFYLKGRYFEYVFGRLHNVCDINISVLISAQDIAIT